MKKRRADEKLQKDALVARGQGKKGRRKARREAGHRCVREAAIRHAIHADRV